MRDKNIFSFDLMLMNYSHSVNEFAEVCIIWIGHDFIEKCWGKSIEVKQVLPCFVPTVDLFSWVMRRVVKYSRKVRSSCCNGFTMSLLY